MATRGRPPLKRKERRRKDTVMGRGRYKLSTPEIQGYETRWVNDVDTRIHEFTVMNDYDFVTEDEIKGKVGDPNVTPGNQDVGSRVSRVVGTDDKGNPITAYLLKIKKEFYEEDQAEKMAAIDETEAQIKRKQFDEPIERSHGKGVSISR